MNSKHLEVPVCKRSKAADFSSDIWALAHPLYYLHVIVGLSVLQAASLTDDRVCEVDRH